LRDLVPKAARIAVLVNPSDTSTAEATLRDIPERSLLSHRDVLLSPWAEDRTMLITSAHTGGQAPRQAVARKIDRNCREIGFFTIDGHVMPIPKPVECRIF
jgi:hypothetical protein